MPNLIIHLRHTDDGKVQATLGSAHGSHEFHVEQAAFDYAAAREKFGRALEMRQAIGDYAGEAITLAQIGFVAWENGRRESGIRLQTIAFMLLKEIGLGQQQRTWKNITSMASAMNLDQAGFETMLQDAMEQYRQDRGRALISAAY